MARTKQINKKRNRATDQDKDLEEEAREPQEMNLYEHLSSLYNNCNPTTENDSANSSNNNNNNNIIVPPNVIVKTSFKEFNVHDFAVKRSGLFRTMIDSNEQWKLGKIDGKFNIDLTSVEESILTADGGAEPLKREDFDSIFLYLYCDEFNVWMDAVSLKRIIDIAKYLDIPSLIKKILDKIQFSLRYYPIKYSLKGELTEEELIELIFKLHDIIKQGFGEKEERYSNELISYICNQQLVPLFIKVYLLQNHLKQNGAEITKEMLQPFSECIKTMRKESKYLLPSQVEEIDSTMFKLLELKQSKEENPCTNHKHYRCADTTNIYMGAEEESGENFNLFGDKIRIDVACSSRSSAFWWDLTFQNDLAGNEDGIELDHKIFYKARVGSKDEAITEITNIDDTETIYAPQFDTGGFSATFLFFFKRKR